jgi:hypothetical protein
VARLLGLLWLLVGNTQPTAPDSAVFLPYHGTLLSRELNPTLSFKDESAIAEKRKFLRELHK